MKQATGQTNTTNRKKIEEWSADFFLSVHDVVVPLSDSRGLDVCDITPSVWFSDRESLTVDRGRRRNSKSNNRWAEVPPRQQQTTMGNRNEP